MSKETPAETAPSEPEAAPSPSDRDAALSALRKARKARERAEANELAAVQGAREAGLSWSRIGELYGLTKQGAQQRFKQPNKS